MLPTSKTDGVSSVRFSSGGRNVAFVDVIPAPCVKVCRVLDNAIVAQIFLHCIPDYIEIVPSLDVMLAVGKEDKKMYILALRTERSGDFESKVERLKGILHANGGQSSTPKLELSQKTRESLKQLATDAQIKHMTLTERQASMLQASVRRATSASGERSKPQRKASKSCVIV